MRKTLGILAVLLAAQVGLAVALNYQDSRLSDAPASVALFEFAPDDVDRITIEGANGEKTVLARADDAWQLPEQGGFPADGDKVDTLLDELVGLEQGLPVATSAGALARFDLAEDDFQRRIVLAAGDETLGTVYLGTSQGTRAVHGRRADQEAVYELAFAVYDAPAGMDDWIDKTILQLPKDEIAAIDVDGLHLTQVTDEAESAADDSAGDAAEQDAGADTPAEPAWQLAGAGEADLKPEAADKLADKLAELRISSVLGTEAKPDYGLEEPVLSLSLIRTNGEKIDYTLGKAPDEDDYTLKASTRPEYFEIGSYSAEQLVEVAGRDALLDQPADDRQAAVGVGADAEAGGGDAPATQHN